MSQQGDQQRLLERIGDRCRTVDVYLRKARPRAERLTLVSIVSSALAAAFTAGPALGGTKFAASVADTTGAGQDSTVWRVLCLLAMLTSVVAAISANLIRARGAESRIINAETCKAELECLHDLVTFEQVPFPEAVKLYQQYVAKVPFIESDLASARRRA